MEKRTYFELQKFKTVCCTKIFTWLHILLPINLIKPPAPQLITVKGKDTKKIGEKSIRSGLTRFISLLQEHQQHVDSIQSVAKNNNWIWNIISSLMFERSFQGTYQKAKMVGWTSKLNNEIGFLYSCTCFQWKPFTLFWLI